ncbi:MAG: hypothetical protein KTR31_16675 [Myxococcales bacterium]|nr:hypothetical protein [Myxococcales bacterium]
MIWMLWTACEPVEVPTDADLYGSDVVAQMRALQALKAPILASWPDRSACMAVRARRDRLLDLAMGITAEDPRTLDLRYLSLQCELPRITLALAESAKQEWSSFGLYQEHCMAGGASTDPRCLAAISSVIRCESRSGCQDRPLCSPVCGW